MMNRLSNAESGAGGAPVVADSPSAFQHELTRSAFVYWSSLLDGRTMPSRADLSPSVMRKFLPSMGLAEPRTKACGGSDYFIRLEGTRLEQVYGPMTGKLLSEILEPAVEVRWRSAFDAAIASARPVRTFGRMAFQQKSWLEVESFIAPLGNDGRTVSMLMTVVATWEASKGIPAT